MITVEELEEETGIKARKWAGNCYAIACAASDMIGGAEAVYGHWLGPISDKSKFAGRELFVQHGWVLLKDGRVLDPTRWDFEGVEPYIYVGDSDYYDEGGNRFRTAMMEPPPEFDPDEEVFEATTKVLPSAAWGFVEKLLKLDDPLVTGDEYEPGQLTFSQLHWLANVDPRTMQGHAKAIHDMLEHFDQLALMPFDNRNMIKSGRVK